MAKSGQKRAFEDETVRDRGPELAPRPVDVTPVDYSAQIETASAGRNIFLSPVVWDNLSKLSDNVHDTRRANWLIDQDNALNKMRIDGEYANKMYENIKRREATLDATRFNIDSYYDLQEKLAEGKRKGLPARDIVQQHYEEQSKLIDSQFYNAPFMYDMTQESNNKVYNDELVKALNYDYAVTEAKAKYMVNNVGAGLYGDIATDPSVPLKTRMSDTSEFFGALLSNLEESEKAPALQTVYNGMVLSQAKGIANKARMGQIDPEAAVNALLTLQRDGATAMWEVKGSMGGDELKKYPVHVDESTLNNITNLIHSLQSGSDRQTTEKILGGDTYLKLIKTANYLSNTEPDQALADFQGAIKELLPLATAGNKTAVMQLEKIYSAYYYDVMPQVAVRAFLRAKFKGSNPSTVISKVSGWIKTINDTINSQPDSVYDFLKLDNGTTVVDVNIPAIGSDPAMYEYLAGNGGDAYQARRIYYANVVKVLQEATTGDLAGIIVNSDPEVNSQYGTVRSLFSVNNLVLTTEGDNKKINTPALAETVSRVKAWKAAQENVLGVGEKLTDAPLRQLLKDMVNDNQYADDVTKTVLYAAAGAVLMDAGFTDQLMEMSLSSVSPAEKDAANMMQLFGTLHRLGDTVVTSNLQAYIKSGGHLKGKNHGDSDSDFKKDGELMLTGTNAESMGEYINTLLRSYNVPTNKWPTYRYALTNIALATYFAGVAKDKNYKLNVKSVLEEGFMQKIMTKQGVRLDNQALKDAGISPGTVSKMITDINADTKTLMKRAGNNPDFRVQQEGDELKLFAGNDELTLYGYDGTRRSGAMNISVKVNNKPAGMSEEAYIKTIKNQVKYQFILQYLAAPENEKTVMALIKKYNPKATRATYSQLRLDAIQLSNSANQAVNQMGFVNYMYTNGKSAPTVIPKENLLSKVIGGLTWQFGGYTLEGEFKPYDSAGGFFTSPLNNAKGAVGIVGDALKINWETTKTLVTEGPSGLRNNQTIIDSVNDAKTKYNNITYGVGAQADQPGINMYTSYMTAYRPDSRGIKTGNTLPPRREDTANMGTYLNQLGFYIGPRGGFRTPEQNAEVHGDPNSEHLGGQALDLGGPNSFVHDHCGYNPVTKQYEVKTKTLDNLIQAFGPQGPYADVSEGLLFWRPEMFDPKHPSYKKYAPYRAAKLANGKPLFIEDKTHKHHDHFHAKFNVPVVDSNNNFITNKRDKSQWYVEDASKLIQDNSNEDISAATAKTIATMWPTYKPTEFDAKLCGTSMDELNKQYMNVVALAKKYARLNKNVFAGRADYSLLALCPDAKFVMKRKASASGQLTGWKDKVFTTDELLKFSMSPQFGYLLEVAYFEPAGKLSKYQLRVLDAARKMRAL